MDLELNPQELELLRLYRLLNPADREQLIAQIRSWVVYYRQLERAGRLSRCAPR